MLKSAPIAFHKPTRGLQRVTAIPFYSWRVTKYFTYSLAFCCRLNSLNINRND